MTEGPFGDHTGFYSLADLYPQVHVTAITMRRNPDLPATIVGRPPMEDFYLGHATERIFLPLLKLTIPEIVDYHMPAEGIFHNLVFVSIDKQYPGQAYKVMNALWGQGLMSLAKVLVVVDDWVNVRNPQEAWWVALNNIDPERDVAVHDGADGRARPLESRVHVRLEDGNRRARASGPRKASRATGPTVIEMDAATKRGGRDVARSVWTRLPPMTRRRARRTDVRGRVTPHRLRQLRQAAAHGVRAAVRAGRGRCSRPTARPRAPGRYWLGRARVHGGAVRRDGRSIASSIATSTRAIRARRCARSRAGR